MSYRPFLESGELRQMQGLPEEAFDMLVTLLARICDGGSRREPTRQEPATRG